MEGKYIIGDVAKRFGITRPTLIYYDSINLLKPSVVELNGYRYYSYKDVEKLELILTLKESGLKLERIKNFLASPSHEEAIGLLDAQVQRVDEKIEQLMKTKKIIQNRIENIEAYEAFERYPEIRLVEMEERRICKVRVDYNDDEPFSSTLRKLKMILDEFPETYGAMASKFGVCVSEENMLNGEFYIFKYIFEFLETEILSSQVDILPAGTYMTCMHDGPYHFSHLTFKKMLAYNKDHQLAIKGDGLILPIHDVWAVDSEENYMTEFQIPVER